MKKQKYNSRLDESLGSRKGPAKSKSQSMKSRRDESKGMEKAMGKRAYSSVSSMDRGGKSSKKAPNKSIKKVTNKSGDIFSAKMEDFSRKQNLKSRDMPNSPAGISNNIKRSKKASPKKPKVKPSI